MAKTRNEKKALIDRYSELLSQHSDYILVDIGKAAMSHINKLKNQLKETGGEFHVIKNRLFKIAAEETKQPTKVQELAEATGLVVSGSDPTAAAKALKAVQKEFQVMPVRFGVLVGEVVDASQVSAYADIPPREELLARLVGTLNAPLSGFAQVLSGTTRSFVLALSEVGKKKTAA